MNNTSKMKFPRMLRELRVARKLKQREVVEGVGAGLKETTYANAESNNHKTIRLDKVRAIARYYGLGAEATAELEAAWEELPASKWNQDRGEARNKRQAIRDKLELAGKLRVALIEITTTLIATAPDPDTLCVCAPVDMFADPAESSGGEPCELCSALRLLGLPGWTTMNDVIGKLAALQESMVTG